MARMNKNIFFVVLISLVVSLIQIKNPSFFFNQVMDEDLFYVGEGRNFSIYSWTNLNATGITFPILISILISGYNKKKSILPITILSGILVAFLTRTRYVMVSTIIVMSQLILNGKRSIIKRASYIAIVVFGVFLIIFIAGNLGYNINEVIDERF